MVFLMGLYILERLEVGGQRGAKSGEVFYWRRLQAPGSRLRLEGGGWRGAKSGEVFSRLDDGGRRAEGGGGQKGKFLLPFGDAPF